MKAKRKVARTPRKSTIKFQADKSPPVIVRTMRSLGGIKRRAMAKRYRSSGPNLPLLAAMAGPFRSAFMHLIAFAQQRTNAEEERKAEARKRRGVA